MHVLTALRMMLVDVWGLRRVGEVARVLFGRQADEYAQAVAFGDIQQLARRHRVRDADSVEAGAGHLTEVAIDLIEVAVLALLIVGPEGAIGGAAHVQLLRSFEQEFATRG